VNRNLAEARPHPYNLEAVRSVVDGLRNPSVAVQVRQKHRRRRRTRRPSQPARHDTNRVRAPDAAALRGHGNTVVGHCRRRTTASMPSLSARTLCSVACASSRPSDTARLAGSKRTNTRPRASFSWVGKDSHDFAARHGRIPADRVRGAQVPAQGTPWTRPPHQPASRPAKPSIAAMRHAYRR